MPELPEVETTLRGIKPHIERQKVKAVVVRHNMLRWPVPAKLHDLLKNQTLDKLERRAKYLLFHFKKGTLLLHLGMSGRLRILLKPATAQKHDHIDIAFANNRILRFTDPRRFGAILWTEQAPAQHPLLVNIGPEPLTAKFNADYLWSQAQNRKVPIKSFIMNNQIVVGVGNIYATEALFAARIHPETPAKKMNYAQCQELVLAIQAILKKAIKKGGTTLKDFSQSDGSPGYFRMELQVYGQSGKPCIRCQTRLQSYRIGQRSTVFCSHCQPLK